MILSDKQILESINNGEITISPFDNSLLNPNSYDVTLSNQVAMYYPSFMDNDVQLRYNWYLENKNERFNEFYDYICNLQKLVVLDVKVKNKSIIFEIPEKGMIIKPSYFYLYSINEIIGSNKYASKIEGKSSLGRLSLFIHHTAGWIDAGFKGNITLEMSSLLPLKVYPNMKIGQIAFYETGEVDELYGDKKGSKYMNQKGVVASQMNKNFE